MDMPDIRTERLNRSGGIASVDAEIYGVEDQPDVLVVCAYAVHYLCHPFALEPDAMVGFEQKLGVGVALRELAYFGVSSLEPFYSHFVEAVGRKEET